MIFVKENLPDPVTYFENEGLKLTGRGPWRNTSCVFHGGRDSMQIKIESGGFCCMNCGVKGGDVLAYTSKLITSTSLRPQRNWALGLMMASRMLHRNQDHCQRRTQFE